MALMPYAYMPKVIVFSLGVNKLHMPKRGASVKILLADDHPLFREGVRQVLNQMDEHTEIIDAQDFPTLFIQAQVNPDLDLALIDLNMPGMPAHYGIVEFRQRFPDLPLVILSASESRQDISRALDAGALGYVLKSSPSKVILHALKMVLSGGIYIPAILNEPTPAAQSDTVFQTDKSSVALTTRQMEVLTCLLQGMPNKTIARNLDLTEGTVKIHLAAIFRALGVNNRTEAVIAARQVGLDHGPRDSGF
jgi:DNA-binding NarL/FixJ family response regulator